MKSLKKLIFLTCSFVTCLSLALFSACGDDVTSDDSSSVKTSSVETTSSETPAESSEAPEASSEAPETSSEAPEASSEDEVSSEEPETSSEEPESSEEPTFVCDGVNHVWGEWVRTEDPGCLTVGQKQRTCLGDASHVETDDIAERGHDYGNQGICIRCEDTPDFPTYDGSTPLDVHEFPEQDDNGDGIHYGTGKNYDRWELAEDTYYSVEIPRKGDAEEQGFWVSFAVSEPGQYALYSVANNNVKATRFDASVEYIPPTGFECSYLEDGNFISSINCTTTYWSTEWRATFHLTATKANATATFALTRIDAPAWRPGYVHVSVIAEEIDGKKAPEGADGTQAVVVPYDSDYFFDESVGYYRMGTKLNPGEIIYAAIDCNPPRLMTAGDNPGFFTTIQWAGNNLSLGDGYTADGDYLVLDYAPFIMNDPSYGGNFGNSYQDFVNSDGMYPVNKELFRFLNLYVQNNTPMEIDQEIVNDEALYEKCAWLAACYYYKKVKVGTEEVPHEINSMGDHTLTTWEFEYQYFTVRFQNGASANPTTYCTISCDNANVNLIINGKTISGPFTLLFETNDINGTTFAIAAKDGSEIQVTFTLATWGEGSMDYPEQVEITENTITLTPYEAFLCSGDIDYVGYYTFTAETTGTITLTTTNETLLLVNSEPATNVSGDGTTLSYTLEVTEGDVVELYVQAQIPDDIVITIS